MKMKRYIAATALALAFCGTTLAQPPGGGPGGPGGPPPHQGGPSEFRGGGFGGGPGGGPGGPGGMGRRGPGGPGFQERGPGGPGGGPHGPGGRFQGNPEEMREFMGQVMMARLAKELELNDEQTVLMVKKMDEVRSDGRKNRKERVRLMEDLRNAIQNDKKGEEVSTLLDNIIAADKAAAQSRSKTYNTLSRGLEDWQKAKLYLFLQDFEQDMRGLISQARMRAHGFGGPGGGMGPGMGRGPGGPGGPGGPPHMRGGDDFGGAPPHMRGGEGRRGRQDGFGGPPSRGRGPEGRRGPGGPGSGFGGPQPEGPPPAE